MIEAKRYGTVLKPAWDAFVDASKNGTFLLKRGYMDYHADRFEDCSLVLAEGGRIVGLLPANRDAATVHSHQGLTYGGFVVGFDMTTPRMLRCFEAVIAAFRAMQVRCLVYKTIPHIYHRAPAEEDLYALFRCGAALYRRDILSVVEMAARPPLQERRQRGAKKASQAGVEAGASDAWPDYWSVLTARLAAGHGARPVHDLGEILLLRGRFPENIRLFAAHLRGELVAGVVVYEASEVAHCQYIAASERGRSLGALDLLTLHLLDDVYRHKRYVDLGISNEQDGRVLNEGLIEQKEGYGARAIAHDFYRLDI